MYYNFIQLSKSHLVLHVQYIFDQGKCMQP